LPPDAVTAGNGTPANVDPHVQQTKSPGKTGGKTQSSRIPLEPTDDIALSALKEARAADARNDVDTGVRMAQRSYAAQKNLAAHHLAIKLRCQSKDMVNGPAELSKVPKSDLTARLIELCRSNGIELPK
ncbi:hypothetical protein HJC22_35470, partial [Corallococcus exiguus]|uniref:hypothetical protein n=1 Tax=Corallococcus exiguus TaxID=83462 RepID=UPI001470938B